jgi:hypothetical protein
VAEPVAHEGGMQVHSVSVNLEPSQFLSGWRPESGAIFLPTLSEARVGDEVAARIGVLGQTIRATVFGKIAGVRRVGRPSLPPGIDLRLDPGSIPAAGFLAMAARGEPVNFKERAPRYSVERALGVIRGGARLQVATINVGDGGCSIRWPGKVPPVGELLLVRVGSGIFAPRAEAVVCWNLDGGDKERAVGLRLRADGRAGRAWKSLVAEAASSGARPA